MKSARLSAFLALFLMLAPVHVLAQTTWIVDQGGAGDFPTIQGGIDAASDGDTVLVVDGTYTGDGNKNLDYGGKAITLKSQSGPGNCIIDGEGSGRGVYFHTAEGPDSVLEGFTITNFGHNGIFIEESDPVINNCDITGNTVWDPCYIGNLRESKKGYPGWYEECWSVFAQICG